MEDKLLEKGDVITLKKGMKVYTKIPEMFVYSNRLTSEKLTSHIVTIGITYTNKTNISDSLKKVANGIVERFNWEGFDISFEDALCFVGNTLGFKKDFKIPESKPFKITEGDFVVIDTSFESHGLNYPGGYRVFCKKLKDGKFDKNGLEVNFYQTGSFTAMITDIKPINKMEISYE